MRNPKALPEYLNVMQTFTPSVWAACFLLEYLLGTVLFLGIRLFKGVEKRVDFHDATLLITLRLYINSAAFYKPKTVWLRLYFFVLMFYAINFFSYTFVFLQYRVNNPVRPAPVQNVTTLLNEKFAMRSSEEIWGRLKLIEKVIAFDALIGIN